VVISTIAHEVTAEVDCPVYLVASGDQVLGEERPVRLGLFGELLEVEESGQ
jgi:hypothetical protein